MDQEPRLSPKRQALLDHILKKKGVKTAKTNIPRRTGDRTMAPISLAQQRLWLLDQLEPNSSAYNISLAVRFSGSLNVAVLEQSLNEVVRRHESLRTTFAVIEGKTMQVVSPTLHLPLPVFDLSELTDGEQETRVRQLMVDKLQHPFDLAQGPLVRVTLLRLSSVNHVFLFTMHHIISDGWSLGVFIRESTVLYEAYLAGQPPAPDRGFPLPEAPIQYTDFSIWQRGWLQGDTLENQLAYWKQQLTGAPLILELPADKPRPPELTFQGSHLTLTLPRSLQDNIQALSRKEGVTPFMTILAAFQTLLYRYTGQTDLVVGTPVANRNHPEIEELIGFFVNTLALRTDLSGNPTFLELLQRTRETTLGAYKHQDMPFEMLMETLNVPRSLSHAPLFQVMFVLQNLPVSTIKLSSLTLDVLETESRASELDLTLSFTETEQGLVEDIEYNTDLFDLATIQRLSKHFEVLLTALVANPGQRILALPLLTETERRQMLVEWNDTQIEWAQDKCVYEIIEGQAQCKPNAMAVIAGQTRLTYLDLNRQANRLARRLRALGVGPDVLVGVCLNRSVEAFVAILGIHKAGGAYVPMDPGWPKSRLAFVLSDTHTPLLLTQQPLLDKLPENTPHVLCLDTDWMDADDGGDQNLERVVSLDHLAYIIYTSGSTGVPKGVLVSQRHLLHSMTTRMAYYPEPLTGYLLVSPFAFDSSVTGIFWPLCAGGVLVLPPDNFHEELTCLADLIEKYRLSHFVWVPSLYHLLLTEAAPEKLTSLSCVIVAGETCAKALVEQHFNLLHQTALYNEFGPTECSVWSSVYRCVPDEKHSQVPCGYPIGNVQAYVLDENMQPVPVGVVGEVYFGGNGVTRGYLNQPALTADRYLPDAFGSQAGRRLYKTGDLARYLPDGNLDFMGRRDHQIKLHGFRIELAEIEAALSQHPLVRETVVLIPEHTERLVAYIVTHDGQKPTSEEMRRFLQEHLPVYMLPSAFVTLEKLPRTSTGKIDRRALPEPENTVDTESYQAPRTPVETVLANIWTAVLGLARVSVYDNFFALGGDSIISIQVASRAKQAGLHVTPRQLFQYQTIAELAESVDASSATLAEQGPVTGAVALTPIQHWFFEQDLTDWHHSNQSVLLEVKQPLNPALLEKAVEVLLSQHDALRMRFERTEAGWQQTNASVGEVAPFTQFDLAGLSDVEQQAAIERQIAALQESLNLSTGPLMQVAYLHLGATQPDRLSIVIHQLVVDGFSWRILFENLEMVYGQLSRGESISLPPKTTSFKQWAGRLVECAQSEATQQELGEWLNKPWDSVLPIPADYSDGANTNVSQSVTVSLSIQETQALLQDVPWAYRTQINDALLSALVQAFGQWTGNLLLLADLEGHRQDNLLEGVDLSRTVGRFTSVFPVLLDMNDAQTPDKALIKIKEQLRCILNSGINYGLLRYISNDSMMKMPRAQVLFNYLGQVDQIIPGTGFGLFAETTVEWRTPREAPGYPLEIHCSIWNGQLQLTWMYNAGLYRPSTIERIADDYLDALREIIAHCQSLKTGKSTPDDFPAAKLSQEQLEKLVKAGLA